MFRVYREDTDLFTQQIKDDGVVKHLFGVKHLHIILAVTSMSNAYYS